MADFDPPFASVGGVNRSPTTDEQSDGFGCGAADQTLFHRLFGRIEAELKAIQDAGGIAGSEADDTTVLQAIMALIDAATGGGDTSTYVLFTQAQARFPIFPEVTTNNGVIAVSSPATGTVRVPASAAILHRGIGLYTTVQTDLATTASKTYHLRWNKDDGFALKDLANAGYNPSTLAESDPAFDSTFDDMLVARVVTNSSNVATITNLVNKSQITTNKILTPTSSTNPTGIDWYHIFGDTYNWARTPDTWGFYPVTHQSSGTINDDDYNIRDAASSDGDFSGEPVFDITRYRLSQRIRIDGGATTRMHWSARA